MTDSFLRFSPAVFAVGNDYLISALVKKKCAFAVEINGKRYCDHTNGVVRTAARIHRVRVPQSELDSAGKYSVIIIPLISREAYFSEFDSEIKYDYNFSPVPEENINIYHISDTHGRTFHAVKSYQKSGKKADLLILNGDIVDSSERESYFDTIYKLADKITAGSIPIICSRGNHDLRGTAAEIIADYFPTEDGKTYYTVKCGNIWALVLDCGEDKTDDHEEYGGSVCCHEFRLEETEFIKDVIKNADKEYNSPEIKHRLIIAHNPFTHIFEPPFDIEQDLYESWVKLIGENIKPELFFAGHVHSCFVSRPGDEFDSFNQPCDVIVGSKPDENRSFTGCAVTLEGNGYTLNFCKG